MTVTVSACLIIDTSASMSPWVANTLIDSKAFVSYALPGDAIGVVNYDVNANNCYAPNGQMAVVDATLSQIAAASQAISSLTFNGNCTNIGGGIQAGYNLLTASSVAPKATVLLTDGQQNCGTSPINVPPSFPVYACGMGSYVDAAQLQQVASRTNGLYYGVAYPVNMMQIYNQIRSSQPRIQSVLNYLTAMTPTQQSLLLPAAISTPDLQQVGVVWSDPSFVYSSNPSPTGNQLYIVLYQPDGQISPITPNRSGPGYVIFDVGNPMNGTWNVYVQYAGTSNSLSVTTGVFEFTPAGVSEALLTLETPEFVKVGSPLTLNAHLVHDDGEPITVTSMTARVMAPMISVKNALIKYADDLKALSPVLDEPAHEQDTPERRLALLHRLYLPTHDILPYRRFEAPLATTGDATRQLQLTDTQQSGSYNLVVHATGYSQKSGLAVQRTQLVSVPVIDG